jgi:hypothetical protein
MILGLFFVESLAALHTGDRFYSRLELLEALAADYRNQTDETSVTPSSNAPTPPIARRWWRHARFRPHADALRIRGMRASWEVVPRHLDAALWVIDRVEECGVPSITGISDGTERHFTTVAGDYATSGLAIRTERRPT